jgi:hypothetical protein
MTDRRCRVRSRQMEGRAREMPRRRSSDSRADRGPPPLPNRARRGRDRSPFPRPRDRCQVAIKATVQPTPDIPCSRVLQTTNRCHLAIKIAVRRGANGSDPAGKRRRTVGRSPPRGRRLQRRLSGDPARSARSGDHRPLERGEIAPSIGVARKLAEALGVTLDDLVGENELATLRDKAMLERWQTLETLPAPDRERILLVLDSLMRDAKTRQAYLLGPARLC